MVKSNRLNYHATFDPGNAAIQFPLKDRRLAAELDHEFDRQIRNTIRFHLLWRRSMTVRHMDLFNNIPLMRFMRSNEADTLCRQGMLRVVVPDNEPFRDLFRRWALTHEGQHFHHLTPKQQTEYNAACKGGLNTTQAAAGPLYFPRYSIDLEKNLSDYDFLFRDSSSKVTLAWNPPATDYPTKVLAAWEQLVQDQNRVDGYRPQDIQLLDTKLRIGVGLNWRRRQFFTMVESLQPQMTSRRDIIRDVEILVLNGPFYDELEQMRYTKEQSAPVWVTRDITLVAVDTKKDTQETCVNTNSPTPFRRQIAPFHQVPLEWILRWHDEGDPNDLYVAFRRSVEYMDMLMNSPGGVFPASEVYKRLNEHVDIVNECIRKTEIDEQQKLGPERESTVLQAYAPSIGAASLIGANSAIALLTGVIGAHLGWTGMQNVLNTGVISLLTTALSVSVSTPIFKVKTTEWDRAEAIFKRAMEAEVSSVVTLAPDLRQRLR